MIKSKLLIFNLIIPFFYFLIAEIFFNTSDRGKFYPYFATIMFYLFHAIAIFAYAKIKKQKFDWILINFTFLMVAFGLNIFIFEHYIYNLAD